jgi:Zn finger protein HypA/HybF involved in hydrogenase expression
VIGERYAIIGTISDVVEKNSIDETVPLYVLASATNGLILVSQDELIFCQKDTLEGCPLCPAKVAKPTVADCIDGGEPCEIYDAEYGCKACGRDR